MEVMLLVVKVAMVVVIAGVVCRDVSATSNYSFGQVLVVVVKTRLLEVKSVQVTLS